MAKEYYLPIDENIIGEKLYLDEFPELKITVLGLRNRLCPSYRNPNIKCFWEGDLEVVLNVNGKEIIINDHDSRRGVRHDFAVNSTIYMFRGLRPEVRGHDIYLVFSVLSNFTTFHPEGELRIETLNKK